MHFRYHRIHFRYLKYDECDKFINPMYDNSIEGLIPVVISCKIYLNESSVNQINFARNDYKCKICFII